MFDERLYILEIPSRAARGQVPGRYKTCLTCQAKQMHAGVAQLIGVHPIEVCEILKIRLHIVLF